MLHYKIVSHPQAQWTVGQVVAYEPTNKSKHPEGYKMGEITLINLEDRFCIINRHTRTFDSLEKAVKAKKAHRDFIYQMKLSTPLLVHFTYSSAQQNISNLCTIFCTDNQSIFQPYLENASPSLKDLQQINMLLIEGFKPNPGPNECQPQIEMSLSPPSRNVPF